MQVERCFAGGKLRPGKIIRFIFPTYLTSLFTTLYTIMDGVFVSTYVGTDALGKNMAGLLPVFAAQCDGGQCAAAHCEHQRQTAEQIHDRVNDVDGRQSIGPHVG